MNKWDEIEVKSNNLYEKVSFFLQNEFGTEFGYQLWNKEIFEWKLDNLNPARRGYMFIAMLNNQVIGVATLTKKIVIINGKKILCGEIGDTYSNLEIRRSVLPRNLLFNNKNPNAYENKSIFGRLVTLICNKAKKDGVAFIYGTPNENSYPGYTNKLAFKDEKELFLVPYTKITSLFFKKKFFYFKFIFSIYEILSNNLLNIFYKYYALIHQLQLKEHTPSEAEIESIWLSNKSVNGLCFERNYNYWEHRYLKHPTANYKFFSIYKSNKIYGFCVSRIISKSTHESELCIAEWMFLNNKFLFFSINKITNYFKKNKITKIIIWDVRNKKNKILYKLNFFIARRRIPIIFKFFNNNLNPILQKSKNNFFMGSSDTI